MYIQFQFSHGIYTIESQKQFLCIDQINTSIYHTFFLLMWSLYSQFKSRLFRSEDWNRKGGLKCFNETKPVMKKKHWGTGSDKRIMSVVNSVVGKMKVPITFLNVTQISEYRIDAHSSIYTETGGRLLTKEERADPMHHADCIHWCLPGVPDTWNQIFLAHL